MNELTSQLRRYGDYLDTRFPDVGVNELRNLRLLTPEARAARHRPKKLVPFVAAATISLLVVGGTALLTLWLTAPEAPVTGVVPPIPPPVTMDSTTTVAPTTTPPMVTSTVPSSSTTIAPAAGFLSCEALVERGNSYGRAVAYWGDKRKPAELDVDGDGIPCEGQYPLGEVEDLFGGPDALEVTIREELATWTAEGPAVDAGLICSSGTKIHDGESRGGAGGNLAPQGTERYSDSYARIVDMRLVCDDGSGEFTLGADWFFEWSSGPNLAGEHGAWYIVEGTGAYERFTGGGFYRSYAQGPRIGGGDATGRVGPDDGS